MTMRPLSAWKWTSVGAGVLSGWMLAGGLCRATGFYGPNEYLQQGGQQIDQTPEFYWEIEVKRLARDFRPADAPAAPAHVFPPALPGNEQPLDEVMKRPTQLTAEVDRADFAAALREGRIKPPNAAAAQKEHDDAREAVNAGTPLPVEFPSEFSEYHRGAMFFRQGKDHYEEARKAWLALLARPAAERHYRTVWAAFMLGKLEMKVGSNKAPEWFQKTRAFAREGFADSLGMAADSYGWEGRSEWKQGHPDKAARLFLTQLALGDESAVISLKAIIPDRDPVEGLLNYGPELDEVSKWSPAEKKEAAAKQRAGLKKAAADPLLRRLETVHILATETTAGVSAEGSEPAKRENRIKRWFAVLHEAGITKTEDAEYLGWAAYQLGDYKTAAQWLELAKEGPAALWLRAKLQRRAGKMEEAAKSMVQAWQSLQGLAKYTGWKPAPAEKVPGEEPEPEKDYDLGYDGGFGFTQHAGGNLGGLSLARGEFLQAFDAFRKGHLWEDAAFVAESILTVEELKAYVDRETAAAPRPTDKEKERLPDHDGDLATLRWLLGRRLVRVDRYAEAREYLPPPYDKVLDLYTKALADGANTKLANPERARAWFTAAWLARYDGMELMGTEVAPDGFVFQGDFESNDIAKERRTGKYVAGFEGDGQKPAAAKPIALKPTKEELERLNKFRVAPDVRWHYRVIAGILAMKAAALLPDNTPELADVINNAGRWVTERDQKAADKYFLELMKRAPKTEIGKAAKAKHWFVDKEGPWSERESAAHEQLVPK